MRDIYGRYYEDFNIGDIYKHWPGKTIESYDNMLFSLLTMNQHPLHIDENYCKSTRFGKRLVNGTFVFSLTVGMSVSDISGKAIAMLEYENVKHLKPTFHGDTLYAETKVLDKKLSKSKPNQGIVYVETRAYNQNNETVLTFKRKVLIPKKIVNA